MRSCSRGAVASIDQYATQHRYTGLVQWENPGARGQRIRVGRVVRYLPISSPSE